MNAKMFVQKINKEIALVNIALTSNVFIWYFLAFTVLKSLINEKETVIWCFHFIIAIISAIIGSAISERTRKKTTFLISWMFLGIFSSILLMIINIDSYSGILIISSFIGMSFGLGVPASLGIFASSITIENRGKFAGLLLFLNGLGYFFLGIFIKKTSVFSSSLVLTVWRFLGLVMFLLIKQRLEEIVENKARNVSFSFIFHQRSFILYFLPWIMFSVVNYLSGPIQESILGSSLIELLIMIESALIGAFSIVGGFLSDFFGRKRMAITGFVLMGVGYAILGVYPQSLLSWYFYTVVDGIAWGIFYVIFIMTIWGDLSVERCSDKYYAIGGLPYFFSNFMRIIISPYITKNVSAYAIFSFASFFLFLAVVPLMYAPETLPEKKIRERELRKYVEKAKKLREKYVKE